MKLRVTILSLFLLTALAIGIGGVPSVRPAPPVQTVANASTPAPLFTIPFELANKHIVLKVQVNNSRLLSFVLDTGDKFAIIDLERGRELGLKLGGEIRMQGAGTETPRGYTVHDSSFAISGMTGFSQRIDLALPIGRLSSRLGQDFDGIIGHDFIKNFVVEIDYQTRLMKLYDKNKFAYDGRGESVPIRITSGGHPIVQAEVTPSNDVPVKGNFVIDIGSGLALALYSPFVAERKLLGPNTKVIKALGAGGAGGAVRGKIGRVNRLKLGNFSFSNPITFFAEDSAGAFAARDLVGNIGAQIMNRFRVILDYERNRIILEPNSDFDKPYDRAFSGLSIQAEGKDYKTFRIVAVLENSPASEVGLQPHDILTAVDRQPAAELTLTVLNELFERTNTYSLTVKRGEQTLQVRLTPKRLI